MKFCGCGVGVPQATAIVRLRDIVRANRYYVHVHLDSAKMAKRNIEIAEVLHALQPSQFKTTPNTLVADGEPVDGQTLTWLATEPEGGHPGGRYFYQKAEETPSAAAQDDAAAGRLWTETETLLAKLGF